MGRLFTICDGPKAEKSIACSVMEVAFSPEEFYLYLWCVTRNSGVL